MASLCVTWVMFFAVTFVSSDQRIYQPYGPAMCRALKTRYGGTIRYHGNNLTCVVSDEGIVSADKTCAEVIQNRKGQPVCIQATSSEPLPTRLFIKFNETNITTLNVLLGTQMNRITLPESKPFMSCSRDFQKLYFYSRINGSFCFDPLNHNVETVTAMHKGKRIRGMAVDGTAQILYVCTYQEVLEWKIEQDSDFHLFQGNLTIIGIGVSSKRGQIILYNSMRFRIYTSSTSLIIHERDCTYINDIACDDDNDLVYITRFSGELIKMSLKNWKLSIVIRYMTFPLHIDVYQDIVVVYWNLNLTAINMTSKTQIWSQKLSDMADLCVLP